MTCHDIASRYLGLKEVPGSGSHPFILWCYKLCDGSDWAHDDAVPWCSAFQQHAPFELGLTRSRSLRARSWLHIGEHVSIEQAQKGNDVVILRNKISDPGPEVTEYQGHVTLFDHLDADGDTFWGLGGNQSDQVSIAQFKRALILGVRRLA